MARGLTDKQNAMLDYLRREVAQHGSIPTVRDICKAFGYKSLNSALDHLRALERKGYLVRQQGLKFRVGTPSQIAFPKHQSRDAVLMSNFWEHARAYAVSMGGKAWFIGTQEEQEARERLGEALADIIEHTRKRPP